MMLSDDWSPAIVAFAVVILAGFLAQVIKVLLKRCYGSSAHGPAKEEFEGNDFHEERLVLVLADPCRPLAATAPATACSNHPTPTSFDCEACRGSLLALHRPTCNQSLNASGSYPYSEHMHGRKRLWEFRWQLTFHKKLTGRVFMGLEQDKFVPVNWAQRFFAQNVVAVLRRASGGAMYQSYGDDPACQKGEAERPTVVFPLSLVDQLIITPSGQMPPSLSDPFFPSLGITKADDRKAFRKVISELEFVPGPTYTFGFWCVSQYADGIGWRSPATAFLPEMKFCDIGIYPPCYFVMYALSPQHNGEKSDSRHLDSRKAYMFRTAYWSTLVPPDLDRVKELQHGEQEPPPATTKKHARRTNCGCCF